MLPIDLAITFSTSGLAICSADLTPRWGWNTHMQTEIAVIIIMICSTSSLQEYVYITHNYYVT